MKDFDEFRPEQIEEQIELLAQASADESSGTRVVQALQGFYARDAAMLEEVWQRLEEHRAARKVPQMLSLPEKKQEKISVIEHRSIDDLGQQTMYASPGEKRQQSALRLFGALAAALICVLLIGSVVFVSGAFKRQSQANPANHGQAPVHIKQATPLPTPPSRGNAAGLYVVDSDTLYRMDPASGKKLWHYSLPGDPNAKNGPLFLGFVFATGDGIVYVGENDGGNPYPQDKLYAFDASTGHRLWTLPLDVNALRFANGTLYAVLGSSGIAAINPSTGSIIWQNTQMITALGGRIIAVDHGIVYGFNQPSDQASFQLFALRASNGAKIWVKTETGLQVSPDGQVFVNGVLYVDGSSAQPGTELQSAPNYVRAYRASDGHNLWQSQPLSGMVMAAPAVVNGLVYIGTTWGHFYALKAADGFIKWQLLANGDASGPAYVVNNTLYIAPTTTANGSVSSMIGAYNATNGMGKWERPISNMSASNSGKFIVTASRIYCLVFNSDDAGSSVQLLDAGTGNPIPGSTQKLLAAYAGPFMLLAN